MFKDSTGAIFLKHDEDYWLPLFTSIERVQLFCRKTQLQCTIAELGRWHDVMAYFSNPPSRASGKYVSCNSFVVDPTDYAADGCDLFDRLEVLGSLKSLIQKNNNQNKGRP